MAFLRFSSLSYVIVGGSAGILALLCILFFVFRFSCTFKRRNLSRVRTKSSSSWTTTETREIEEVKVEMGSEIVKGGKASSEVGDVGWGRWYSMTELVAATGNFCVRNVIGEGGYGVVYRGVFPDKTVVAVKRLLNNKGQAQREFKVEVEAVGRVRHKNLVGLVGYCDEGPQRMLVYEYLDNGNLEQWLHGKLGATSPLTWDIRMKIAFGTARGLTYLHEGLEPKVVHRDIKSSNILLDKSWNAKVSDFGLAKLLETESSYVRTRVMGTFGYVAPEYASTGMLTEASDVYSFGILLMEIVSGRNPVDYNRPAAEVNLVDWFRYVARNRHSEEILDPLMEAKPSPKALKRILLICLRCVHPDTENRPKIGQVLHMLEGNEFPFRAARGALPDNVSLATGCSSPVLMSGNASPLLDPASGGASPLLAGK